MSPRKQSVNPIDTAVQPSSDSSISLNDAAYAIGQEAAGDPTGSGLIGSSHSPAAALGFLESRVDALPVVISDEAHAMDVPKRSALLLPRETCYPCRSVLGPFVVQRRDLYRTPDERSTDMTVRWSRDSAKVLVTGPKFDVVEAARVGHDRLYFLYEVQADRRWTNASADHYRLPRFTAEDVASIPWVPDLDAASMGLTEGSMLLDEPVMIRLCSLESCF